MRRERIDSCWFFAFYSRRKKIPRFVKLIKQHLQWASGTKSGVISNTEMYERIAPQNKDMPYVYDAVLYWEGCKGESLYVSAARQKVVSERYGHDEAPSSTTRSIEGVHGSSS